MSRGRCSAAGSWARWRTWAGLGVALDGRWE